MIELRKPTFFRRARYLGEYITVRFIVCIILIVPLSWCQRLAQWLAYVFCDVFSIRHKIIDENLRHVYPGKTAEQRKDLARQMWYHLALMVCEIAHAPRKIHDSNWRKYVYIRDRKLMTEYFLDWRPVVLVSGHLGNFELALYITGILGIPTYAIARPFDNPWLQRWITGFRELHGQFILPSFGSSNRVQEVLEAGGMLSLLGDQHAGTKGCWIDFLGRPAACHKALALFTLLGEAPMIVIYAVRTGGPLSLEIGFNGIADPKSMPDELREVRALTQWYNGKLGELILETPDQYWWVHRRWKEKPVRETKKRLAKKQRAQREPSLHDRGDSACAAPWRRRGSGKNVDKAA